MVLFRLREKQSREDGTEVMWLKARLTCPQKKFMEVLHLDEEVGKMIWDDFKAHFKSDTTIRSYQSDIVEFCDYVEKKFVDIKRSDVQNYFDWLMSRVEQQELKPATMAKKFRECHSMAEYICENREKYNLEEGFEDFFYPYLTRVAKQEKLAKSIPVEEIDKLLEVSQQNQAAYVILILLYRIGLSSTEIIEIKSEDIEQYSDGYYVWIKSRSEACYLPDDVVEILVDYLCQREVNEYLFCNRAGRKLNTMYISRLMKKYTSLAGIPSYSAETLRNSCGFTMYAYGAKDKQVASQLGITQMQIKRYDDVRYKDNIQKQAQNLVKIRIEPPK